jgi:hypothetical protein
MSVDVQYHGRLGNNIIQYLVGQYFSKKFNLRFNNNIDLNEHFDIKIFSGLKEYNDKIEINDNNIIDYLNKNSLDCGIIVNGFFQLKELFKNKEFFNFCNVCLKPKKIDDVIDLFIHVRLGDIEQVNMNLPYEYYKEQIDKINHKNILISTDNPDSHIIKKIQNEYLNVKLFYCNNPSECIRYGAQAKNLIIGNGSFGFCMALFSLPETNVYCVNHETVKNKFNIVIWDGDMIDGLYNRENTYFYS